MNKITEIISSAFLGNMAICVNAQNGESYQLAPTLTETENGAVWTAANDVVDVAIKAEADCCKTLFSIDLVSKTPLSNRAVTWNVSVDFADDVLSFYHSNKWWMMPEWVKKKDGGFSERTQNYIFRTGDKHIGLTALTGDIFCCESEGFNMYLETGLGGFSELHGAFLCGAVDSVPDKAMEKAYKYARKMGAIRVPLKEDRKFPEMFENFGWCTWDAFYHEVSAEKIFQKLDELKEKNIPIKWMLIDDGWCHTVDGKMYAMKSDDVKFPDGLKACVDRIKNEYGIKYVGVWHTISGYWGGVHMESPLAEKYKDNLFVYGRGRLSMSQDPDKAFVFWDDFHGYLEDCGIDYVKVDNQSTTHESICENFSTTAGVRPLHEALERSVNKHFDGKIINCMGMDMENVLARPSSAVNRNSDDFFPNRENGFAAHIKQNVYNTLWHSNIMHCDFDMWWSGKANPVQSGVLRAISGGPVYVSDKVGESDFANIYPICGNNGDLCRLDNAAKPTLDCIYSNCEVEGKLQKIYNNRGDALALALFNISREEVCDSFGLDVIPTIEKDRDYICYEYFTKTFTRVNAATKLDITLGFEGVKAYSLYPVMDDGEGEYIMLGETDKYFGVGSREKTKTLVKDLL